MFIADPIIPSQKSDQTGVLEALIAGKDVLAILLTGFGKSVTHKMRCNTGISGPEKKS